mmetsp:Transcript_13326/g.27204  ORF Transcript_13326/g.27204 Transcript_13326/m.27204 type:complete len:315 (+) Transcript_13326:177-1121(+)
MFPLQFHRLAFLQPPHEPPILLRHCTRQDANEQLGFVPAFTVHKPVTSYVHDADYVRGGTGNGDGTDKGEDRTSTLWVSVCESYHVIPHLLPVIGPFPHNPLPHPLYHQVLVHDQIPPHIKLPPAQLNRLHQHHLYGGSNLTRHSVPILERLVNHLHANNTFNGTFILACPVRPYSPPPTMTHNDNVAFDPDTLHESIKVIALPLKAVPIDTLINPNLVAIPVTNKIRRHDPTQCRASRDHVPPHVRARGVTVDENERVRNTLRHRTDRSVNQWRRSITTHPTHWDIEVCHELGFHLYSGLYVRNGGWYVGIYR